MDFSFDNPAIRPGNQVFVQPGTTIPEGPEDKITEPDPPTT